MKMMKIAVVLLALSVVAFAQHGHGGGGGHMGGSSGMGNMGGGNGMGGGMGSGHGMGDGPGQMRGSQMGKQAPADVLSHNTKLSSNLEKMLPKGMTAEQACGGFKNLGQCVAAVHVSHNLDIPFDQLKAKMTGTGSESLGKAIGDLKPNVDAKGEAKKAQKQADNDLNES